MTSTLLTTLWGMRTKLHVPAEDLLTYLEIYDGVTDEIFISSRFTYYEPDLHHLLTVTDF